MSRRKIDPLRPLTDDEVALLGKISRAQAEPAARIARAAILLAVARGDDYRQAARSVGRRSGVVVSRLVTRFNAEGLAALDPRHGGGRPRRYDDEAAGRILREARRTPTPKADGTAVWTLTTLRRALRSGPDGLPAVSTYTIWSVFRRAGCSHQRSRTWCPTGTVIRVRKGGPVVVTDPDASSKKADRGRLPDGRGDGAGDLVHRPGRPVPDGPPARPVVAT